MPESARNDVYMTVDTLQSNKRKSAPRWNGPTDAYQITYSMTWYPEGRISEWVSQWFNLSVSKRVNQRVSQGIRKVLLIDAMHLKIAEWGKSNVCN